MYNRDYSSPGEFFSASLFFQLERGKGDRERKKFSYLPLCFHFCQSETELKGRIFGEYLCDMFLSLPVFFFLLILVFLPPLEAVVVNSIEHECLSYKEFGIFHQT